MRIITERKLREYWQANSNAEIPLRAWIQIVRPADWLSFADVRASFNSVDLHKGKLIFNIGGNNFRVIAKPEFSHHLIFIKAVLTHREYNNHSSWCDCGRK